MQNRPLVGADSEVWKLGGVGKEGWEKGRKEGCGALPHTPAGGSSPCTRGTSCGRTRPERARQRGRPMEQDSRLSTVFRGAVLAQQCGAKRLLLCVLARLLACSVQGLETPARTCGGVRGQNKGRAGPGLGRCFSGVRLKANPKGDRMSAKDVGWTVAISVFVTLYVLWRVGSLLEERAPSQAERGLCAECGEQETDGA